MTRTQLVHVRNIAAAVFVAEVANAVAYKLGGAAACALLVLDVGLFAGVMAVLFAVGARAK